MVVDSSCWGCTVADKPNMVVEVAAAAVDESVDVSADRLVVVEDPLLQLLPTLHSSPAAPSIV